MSHAGLAVAQVNVLTAHNDIARTGQNLNETVLTLSNVNPTRFGKLFSIHVAGQVYAQPLYVSQVAIPGKGTHNVVYVVTATDMVYAFDGDSNGGIDATPLWQVYLLTNTTPAGTFGNEYGVIGTPVIDLSSNTMYLVSSENQNSFNVYRLHALDITTGAEKLGGPVVVQASVPGTGNGSNAGVVSFDPLISRQRPGLLLLNGVLYAAFGSVDDNGPWHGWLLSYSAATLQQIDVLCTSANGSGSAIWMSGAGLAAEVSDPSKPYGRMFLSTGNGTFAASRPYTNAMSYGMSVLDLDLSGGQMTVEDDFTPYNEAALNSQDGDVGGGGPVLLPAQKLADGTTLNPLVQIGKSGAIYILDRNNLGGFNAAGDQVVQEVQTPITAGLNWGAGVWGTEAYWNNNIYSGGTNPDAGVDNSNGYAGAGNSLTAYSFVNGVLSSTPTSQSAEQFIYPGPTPSISANGATNGIVWVLNNGAELSEGPEVLLAYNATNLAHTLYSSATNLSRDSAGGTALKFAVPTVANGKVYAGAAGALNVYGLLGATPTAPAPIMSPGSGTYTGTQKVTITDAVAGATIYYTTDGTIPTSSSPIYSSTSPLVVSTNETVTAIASPNGYLQSAPSSATYVSTSTTANPVFSLSGGTYSGAQTLTITDSSAGAIIYYTVDGSTPTNSSAIYSNALSLPVSETVQAMAVAPGLFVSSMVSAAYTIQTVYTIDFSQGFTLAQGPVQFNGSTDLDDFRLQLTNGGLYEAGSAFYATPVNVQAFTTDFTFQLSNPAADGISFTIQNVSPSALGNGGGGLGYATIANSVAIKFDLHDNGGEGTNSTGLYTGGASPTVPAVNLAGTGIDLHSGDSMDVHITYDGINLALTLTDTLTLASWSNSWPINIPSTVGSPTAYVGFTGGTGSTTASQKVTAWTYLAGPLSLPNYPTGFDSVGMIMNNGAALNGTRLRLTDGGLNETRSAFFTVPVNIQKFSTSFDFQLTNPNGEGITFTIQGMGPKAIGTAHASLGYGSIAESVAIKFDLFNDAGEGLNSTGMYVNGASPTVPSTDLSSTGINLHSGDIFNAQLAYDGTVLTVMIADTFTGATATQSYTVNIPAMVGGPTANVGFTGSTSGSAATQDIVDWSYSTTYKLPTTPPVATLPKITGVSANYGAYYATIAVTGTNFGATQGTSAVNFNGVSANATVWSNTGITVTVPYHATTGNLAVRVGGRVSNGVAFTVEPAPSVASFSPVSGPAGTVVTLSGQNLLDAQGNGQVWFGGMSLPILNSSSTSLQIAVPADAVTGAFDAHVNGVGVYTSAFTVTHSAQISSVNANYGAPYSKITLAGTNFGASQGTSTVTFNGVAAKAASWSNTGISVSVPYRATTGNLVVTVAGQPSNAVAFTVEPSSSIAGISPTSGSAGTLSPSAARTCSMLRVMARSGLVE